LFFSRYDMEADFSWIYLLIFLMFPLARILPRALKKFKSDNFKSQEISQKPLASDYKRYEEQSDKQFESNSTDYNKPPKFSKPETKNMLVLGELNRGVKLFENIQKNTGLTVEELNSILEDLENNGLMKSQQKSGLFGMKTELLPTDKGFKEYYS